MRLSVAVSEAVFTLSAIVVVGARFITGLQCTGMFRKVAIDSL
jgi:hypothetical protein